MVEEKDILTRGGVYLARLDPAKTSEVGKIRPVIILNAKKILEIIPPTVFICPLSSKSHTEFSSLHIHLAARDSLFAESFALVEHCRSISIKRLIYPRLAQLTTKELSLVLHCLKTMIDC